MAMTRREFFWLGGGAGATCAALLAGVVLPASAQAVALVDDAVIGAAVATVAALGGYLVTSGSAPSTLDALGTGFRNFVQSETIKAQAVQLCLQAAAEHEAEILEADAQAAADAVAGVTGFFSTALESAAETGRLALDGVVSGVSAGAGVLRSLVSLYMAHLQGFDGQGVLPGTVAAADVVTNNFSIDSLTTANTGTVTIASVTDIVAGIAGAEDALWALHMLVKEDGRYGIKIRRNTVVYGYHQITLKSLSGGRGLGISSTDSTQTFVIYNVQNDGTLVQDSIFSPTSGINFATTNSSEFTTWYKLSSSMVAGTAILPGVDRAEDAPDVISPGYDSVPLGQDLVVDPDTGAVVGAGTIALPQSVPDVIGGLNDWLDGALAGVVPGTIALPVPVSTPVVVATPDGITTMPIEQARATDTSLVEPGYVPPESGIDPPVTVPEGPWTPAVTLPFEEVWPFNMIFDVVELFAELGA